MTRLPLTLAISEYDHVVDLVNGRVEAEGIDLTCLSLPIEEIFFRFLTSGNLTFRKFPLPSMPL